MRTCAALPAPPCPVWVTTAAGQYTARQPPAHARVVVEDEHHFRACGERGTDAQVGAARVTQVLGAAETRRAARERVAHRLARGVVDHHHVDAGLQARDAAARVVQVLPVDDDRRHAHPSTSSYTRRVCRAVSSHVKRAARARAAAPSAARVSGSATRRASASASRAGSERATSTPASPTTSGTELVATATTAQPLAIASHTVSPKPS